MPVDFFKTDNLNIVDHQIYRDAIPGWQGQSLDCFCGYLSCIEQTDMVGLLPANYVIRKWQAGDVAKPHGRSTRKMKKWWQDYKVPSWMREHWPIIANTQTNEIAAVPGLFVCQGYVTEVGQTGWLVDYSLTV